MDGWVNGWVNGWPDVKSLKSNKSRPNRDNSITDILDIFWTFYLNHLSPLWGYFSDLRPQAVETLKQFLNYLIFIGVKTQRSLVSRFLA